MVAVLLFVVCVSHLSIIYKTTESSICHQTAPTRAVFFCINYLKWVYYLKNENDQGEEPHMPAELEENFKTSEWMVRQVIGKHDTINCLQLDTTIKEILLKVASKKKGGRHLYFTLGVSLHEWLEMEVAVGNLLVCGMDTSNRSYQLSSFIRRLLRKENVIIHKLIHKTTGLERLPI